MTALSIIQDLIHRELGSTGWEYVEAEGYERSWQPGVLYTQRGLIPFSTVKILLELIPELLRETEANAEDAARYRRSWYE